MVNANYKANFLPVGWDFRAPTIPATHNFNRKEESLGIEPRRYLCSPGEWGGYKSHTRGYENADIQPTWCERRDSNPHDFSADFESAAYAISPRSLILRSAIYTTRGIPYLDQDMVYPYDYANYATV